MSFEAKTVDASFVWNFAKPNVGTKRKFSWQLHADFIKPSTTIYVDCEADNILIK